MVPPYDNNIDSLLCALLCSDITRMFCEKKVLSYLFCEKKCYLINVNIIGVSGLIVLFSLVISWVHLDLYLTLNH